MLVNLKIVGYKTSIDSGTRCANGSTHLVGKLVKQFEVFS
jgi:hypothetical protein